MSSARETLITLGQNTLATYLDKAPADTRAALEAQISTLDAAALSKLMAGLSADKVAPLTEADLAPISLYTPTPQALEVGLAALKAGTVAAFTVAGGQGSRLGYEGPKGCFGVTPVKNRPLFEVFALKIRAQQARTGTTIPWVLMTSPQNNTPTIEFFKANNYFGLKAEQFYFFVQGVMPAVDASTKDFLLEAPATLALSPDGHGGSIKGLYQSGALKWLKAKGIKTLSYFQVDNPLVKVFDPLFIGAHLTSGSEFSSKSLSKRDAGEKVGVFAIKQGNLTVVEYSDMPTALTTLRNTQGQLQYAEGNAAIHLLEVAFIEKIAAASTLPYHKALKKVPFVDATGKVVSPDKPNAIKFEQFIFDALPLAQKPMVMQAVRAEEFSPVKNAEGADSLATCQADLLKLWTRWALAAGVALDVDGQGVTRVKFEVAPTFAETQAEFTAKAAGLKITQGTVLG